MADRRGVAGDALGREFRAALGDGLVLDAGCGAGRYLPQLGSEVVGLDATAALLAIARCIGTVPLIRGDLEALPFADLSLAGLFARHSYLHLPKERLHGALREAYRVLSPGGRLLVSLIEGSYSGRSLRDDDFEGRWFSLYQREEIKTVLVKAGLEVAHVERSRRAHGEDLVAHARRPLSPSCNPAEAAR